MTRILVAHTPVLNGEFGDVEIHVGDKLLIVDKPRDINEAFVFMQMEQQGMLDDGNSLLAEVGEGYIIFSIEPDEQGRTLKKWFEIVELEDE